MRHVSRRLALVAGVALAATVIGCGTSGTTSPKSGGTAGRHAATTAATNGLENQTAAQVVQAAGAALKAAKSVHVQGYSLSNGKHMPFEVRIQGTLTRGTYTVAGVRVHTVTAGNDIYFKTDEHGWDHMGVPEEMLGTLAGRWVKVRSAETSEVHIFSIATLAAEMTTLAQIQTGKVTQETVNGEKAVMVTYPDGSKLYVANTGPAYPLRLVMTGRDAGMADFSEYNMEFHITAPSDALDMGSG